jgi:hypothetical protein
VFRGKRLCAFVLALGAAQASAQMLSDRGPPLERLVHRNTVALRINPLGLGYEGRFSYRRRLFATDSVALRDNFIGLGLTPSLTPTYWRFGLMVEAQPTTFLGFWAAYEGMQYFGTVNSLQSFPTASSSFSDNEIKTLGALPRDDPRHPYVAGGTIFTAGANVNLRLGPIVVRDAFKMFRPDFPLRQGDTTMYEQLGDLLLANRRFNLVNDLDVLFQTKFGLLAGLRFSSGAPLYGPESGAADNSTHRIGPFLVYRFFDRDGAAFNQPTVALVVNWYLKHRYRTGAETSAAIPYLAVAFQFSGDLVPLPPVAK